MMYSLATTYIRELEIRKSRFIAYAIPVEDRDAAMQALQRLRDEHPAATHVCWALLAGGQSGMSDDGEPSGTAGRPILEVLRHHDLDGVLGAVVRYYGGVKLGAGGLVRAYTDAIASALLDAERVERIRYTRLAIEIGYPEEARVRRWIEQADYELVDSAYGMTVKLVIKLPETARDARTRRPGDGSRSDARLPAAPSFPLPANSAEKSDTSDRKTARCHLISPGSRRLAPHTFYPQAGTGSTQPPPAESARQGRVCRRAVRHASPIIKIQLRDNGRMHQVQTLQAQLAELDRRIKAARSRERNAVLAQVRELVTSYALTAREIFGQGYSDRAKLFTVGVKYRDPATGATWSGRGRAPAWIVGRDRTAFLIRE